MVLPELQKLLEPPRVAKSIERGCLWLLAITLLAVVYRFCWIDASDPFKCGALLHKGKWLDPGPDSRSNYQKWQPPGCLMYEYNESDIQECLGGRRMLFAGDSITRQIFWAIANKLDPEGARDRTIEMLEKDLKHEDLSFILGETTVDFLWDPYLNTTALERELRSFSVNSSGEEASGSAALILLGAPGLWYARSGQDNFMRHFRDSIDRVIPYMDHLPLNISTPDDFTKPLSSPNVLLLAPIQVPRYESLSSTWEETITPEKIDQMNDYLQQTSAYSNADVLWSYSRMTSSGTHEYLKDGLHVIENVAARKADVLLNLRCNNDAVVKGPRFDRTCCSDYGQTARIQLVLLFLGMVVVPISLILRLKSVFPLDSSFPQLEILKSLKVLGLVVCFCFFTDRTQLFEKAPKQFSSTYFSIACLGAMFVGLGSLRRSNAPTTDHEPSHNSSNSQFLSREQTDEWKGWMQAFMLIYHYSHGSQTLSIHELVRVLVASYLFMTGFGHALYFLQKQDYSMKRVLGVLIRVNLLPCVLPYMMGTDYVFYYFAPLVSFWFLVIYTTLRIGCEKNNDLRFLFGKIVFSCTLTTVCTMIPGVWDSLFSLLRYGCNMDWDSLEWRFRTFLDMYIVYVGITIAVLLHRSSRIQQGLIDPRTRIDNALATIIARPGVLKLVAFTISCLLLWVFWAIRNQFSTKEEYDLWQPYISILPVLAFVGLRNSLKLLRNYHSTVFALLGRCSLEAYILHYHLWLAAGTKALLTIGIWDEWFEAALLTVVFLWISHLTMHATQTLTAWIVGGSTTSSGSRGPISPADEARCGKDSPRLLPSIKSRSGRFKDSSERYNEHLGGPSLQWRLALILFGLWFCNILSH